MKDKVEKFADEFQCAFHDHIEASENHMGVAHDDWHTHYEYTKTNLIAALVILFEESELIDRESFFKVTLPEAMSRAADRVNLDWPEYCKKYNVPEEVARDQIFGGENESLKND